MTAKPNMGPIRRYGYARAVLNWVGLAEWIITLIHMISNMTVMARVNIGPAV